MRDLGWRGRSSEIAANGLLKRPPRGQEKEIWRLSGELGQRAVICVVFWITFPRSGRVFSTVDRYDRHEIHVAADTDRIQALQGNVLKVPNGNAVLRFPLEEFRQRVS